MSIAGEPPPMEPGSAWDEFTRALILERFGRTCPELPHGERQRLAAEAAIRNEELAARYGEAGPELRAV